MEGLHLSVLAIALLSLNSFATVSIDPCPEPTEVVIAMEDSVRDMDVKPIPMPRAQEVTKPPKANISKAPLPQIPADQYKNSNPNVPTPGDAPAPGVPPDVFRSNRGVPVPPMTAPHPMDTQ